MPSDVFPREKSEMPRWAASTSTRISTSRRLTRLLVLAGLAACGFIIFLDTTSSKAARLDLAHAAAPVRPEEFPAATVIPLPRRHTKKLPKIQHHGAPETARDQQRREARLAEVRQAFQHAWKGYKAHAWAQDELRPLEGGFKTPFCGWAATMVDSLDTLWIMGLKEEFELALLELKKVDFRHKTGCVVNLFETTIRHLGGLLAAWDLSGARYPILMEKAVELAEVLYSAFDTPNRMPAPHYEWSATDAGKFNHRPSGSVVLAVLGTLSLEFTRLAQLTGDDKYYDAVQKVMDELEKWQDSTALPGMWPAIVKSDNFNQTLALTVPYVGAEEQYTLGALADSAYEYLPKQYMMLGGQVASYRTMYEKFIKVARKHLFFRPMTVGDEDILIAGTVNMVEGGTPRLTPELQHLTCFAGGMLAIAGKIFNRPEDVVDGGKLADGCVWAYRNTITGIMPETLTAVPCDDRSSCPWDSKKWYDAVSKSGEESAVKEIISKDMLSPGFARVGDARYLLRPEAIESVFIMHRITGDPYWRESGWAMFKSIRAHTETPLAHAAIRDVRKGAPDQVDEMESFWLAETLKYFYLLYSENDVVSLDEYVLNTEAHPLRRPT